MILGKLEEIEIYHEENVEYLHLTFMLDGETHKVRIRRTSIESTIGLLCLEGVKWNINALIAVDGIYSTMKITM